MVAAMPSENGRSQSARKPAIAVSFDSNHIGDITSRRFTAVVRRRVPTEKPDYLYFHVNSPLSALVARAEVRSVRTVTKDEALSFAHELNMNEAQISDYVGHRRSVGIYEIAAIELFKRPVKTQELQELCNYHPPQNFMLLSEGILRTIEKLSQ